MGAWNVWGVANGVAGLQLGSGKWGALRRKEGLTSGKPPLHSRMFGEWPIARRVPFPAEADCVGRSRVLVFGFYGAQGHPSRSSFSRLRIPAIFWKFVSGPNCCCELFLVP